MKNSLATLSLLCALTSCSIVHKMDIEQGNILTPYKVHQLHPGMTRSEVTDLMGTPVLINTFSENRVDYVYTYQPGHNRIRETYITLIFSNGVLKNIKGNMYSQYIK